MFFFPTNFFFSKMFLGFWNACKQKFIFRGGGGILGCLGRPTPPSGGRAGSENNTLLPMTMICDRLKFWSGPAWRSKVIIRKPWRRKNKKKKKKKKKKFWQNHKAFPAGSRECLISQIRQQITLGSNYTKHYLGVGHSRKNQKREWRIYIAYGFPLSLSTIWWNHLPFNFHVKIPYLLFGETISHLTSKWSGILLRKHEMRIFFQYFKNS